MVTVIKEQQVDVGRQSSWVWFGNDVAEDIWKFRFTYGLIVNMAKTERGISIMDFRPLEITRNMGDGGG